LMQVPALSFTTQPHEGSPTDVAQLPQYAGFFATVYGRVPAAPGVMPGWVATIS
jgi:hypothetical protein